MTILEAFQANLNSEIERNPRIALATAKELYQEAVDAGVEWKMPENIQRSLISSWKHAVLFAQDTLRMRWPEFERSVENAPTEMDRSAILHLYNYASNVVKGRFEAAERHIATDPVAALRYAKTILNAPFEDDHPAVTTINATYETGKEYARYFSQEFEARNDRVISGVLKAG